MKHIAYLVISAIGMFAQGTHANQAAIDDFRALVSQCRSPAGEVVRIAFHEPGTYRLFDGKGGNDGSLRLPAEVNAPQNRGLGDAIRWLEIIAKKHGISFADAVVASGIVAIEECGGPKGMPINFGRIDTDTPNDPTRLPPATVTAQQIRDQFVTGMGFTVEETVALIGGGHTVGHVHAGNPIIPQGPLDTTVEKYDILYFQQLLLPTPPNGVVRIPADQNMANDPEMRAIIERFIQFPEQFWNVFAVAYVKLLNLGSKFQNGNPSGTVYNTASTAYSTASSYHTGVSYTTTSSHDYSPPTYVPVIGQYPPPSYAPSGQYSPPSPSGYTPSGSYHPPPYQPPSSSNYPPSGSYQPPSYQPPGTTNYPPNESYQPPYQPDGYKNRTSTNKTRPGYDSSSQANPLILAGTLLYTFLLSFVMTTIF